MLARIRPNQIRRPERKIATTACTMKMKRFTIDVPLDLHTRTKTACAARGINMADLIRAFLEAEFPAPKVRMLTELLSECGAEHHTTGDQPAA